MASVGDEVLYVPDLCHAYNQNSKGQYAWTFGMKKPTAPGKPPSGPVSITDKEVTDLLLAIKKDPRRKDLLVPLTPRESWPAEVKEVNSDGSVNLDIEHALSGVTLSYKNIKEDSTGKIPGTWHAQD